MASTFIANSYHVNFDSVLLISDHDRMLNMFKALEASVNTYMAMNHTIDARGKSDEPGVAEVAVVKRKCKSKKNSETTDETPVEIISEVAGSKKRPATEDSAPDVVPLQIIEPIPAATVVNLLCPSVYPGRGDWFFQLALMMRLWIRRNLLKTLMRLRKNTDEIEYIIGQITADTSKMGSDEKEQEEQRVDETDIGDDFNQWLEESFKDFVVNETGTVVEAESSKVPVVEKDMDKAVGNKHTKEEHMSIDDLLLQIYDYMMLPISTHDKGKEPLEENEPVRGNPAKETVELICGDVDFLVQFCDKVMTDVVDFFHSFSLNKLSDFDGLRYLKEKEKLMLSWAETEFLETAVKRRMYILAKYREMLLRKFLDSHRRFFAPGQPWTAMASQIIALLSVAHSKSLEDILAQQKEHGIIKDRPSSSQFFKDLADNSGAVLAQFYSMAKSTCWVRPMILVNGVWTPIQGNYFWKSSCRLSLFVNRRQVPESVVDTDFVPHGLFIEPVQHWGAAPSLINTWGWSRVCTEIVRYSMFWCLRPVRKDVCRDIVVYNLAVERIPTSFRRIIQQGVYTDGFVGYFSDSDLQSIPEFDSTSSDGSTVYRSPSPQVESFEEAESVEPSAHLALGPAISGVAQEEQSYFVESPESPPPTFQRQDTSASSSDSPMHFNSDDIPLDDTADVQPTFPAVTVDLSPLLD
ncbi:hypothetical protein F511_15355 [Dorcoceras hygrometricum]|uniref:Uncharacterized protein n=1 Tax=Dorcoceras hygrometricum TaxID=472368 RepID=A0A2Z7A7V4_9LAMI|nr:hypothetical protein F511_15355 [Dorcoceras hygrometricum]